MERDTRRLALASVVAGIGTVTLIPVHAASHARRFGSLAQSFAHGSSVIHLYDFIQNMALFIPFGILIALGNTGKDRIWLRAGLCASGLSAAIDCAQAWLPGRYSSAWDVVFNALGGAAGAWLAVRCKGAFAGEPFADQTASG
jgi:glycopeptide antibiotics resistance protein